MSTRSDPLEGTVLAKVVAAASATAAVAAFYLSTQRADPKKLPGVALDSPFLLDLGRAVVVGAVVAAVLIFTVRAWHGYYPSKLSTTGAEYPEREAVEQVTEVSADTIAAVEALRAGQLQIAKAARDDYDRLKEELNALEQRVKPNV